MNHLNCEATHTPAVFCGGTSACDPGIWGGGHWPACVTTSLSTQEGSEFTNRSEAHIGRNLANEHCRMFRSAFTVTLVKPHTSFFNLYVSFLDESSQVFISFQSDKTQGQVILFNSHNNVKSLALPEPSTNKVTEHRKAIFGFLENSKLVFSFCTFCYSSWNPVPGWLLLISTSKGPSLTAHV